MCSGYEEEAFQLDSGHEGQNSCFLPCPTYVGLWRSKGSKHRDIHSGWVHSCPFLEGWQESERISVRSGTAWNCIQWSLSIPVTYYTAEVDRYSLKPAYRIPVASTFRQIHRNRQIEVTDTGFKGTPWGLEYTFSSALFVTTRPIHILVFDAYMPRYICNCFRCSLIAFSASWSRSMCKFQQFPFETKRSQGVPLKENRNHTHRTETPRGFTDTFLNPWSYIVEYLLLRAVAMSICFFFRSVWIDLSARLIDLNVRKRVEGSDVCLFQRAPFAMCKHFLLLFESAGWPVWSVPTWRRSAISRGNCEATVCALEIGPVWPKNGV